MSNSPLKGAQRRAHDLRPQTTPDGGGLLDDEVAFGVLHELDRMGKRAGKALAVVGCDNVVASEHTDPPLTTLSAGAEKIGTIASETLLARINSTTEERRTPTQYFAIPELVVRESSLGKVSKTRHAPY